MLNDILYITTYAVIDACFYDKNRKKKNNEIIYRTRV